MMKKMMMLLLTCGLAVAILGCSGEKTPAAQSSASPVAQQASPAVTPSGDKVEVKAEGTKFDPPVAKEKIPDEAWACVMRGTVHYASLDKGTGKCPTCKMKLKQHAAHLE